MWRGLLLLLAPFIVFQAGCGKTYDVGAFEPYVKKFEAEAARHGCHVQVDNVIIQLGKPNPGAAATCYRHFAKTPKVVIEPHEWQWSSEARREFIIFHELGHCVLGRDHKDERVAPLGERHLVPASLMSSGYVGGGMYQRYRDYYLEELFFQQ